MKSLLRTYLATHSGFTGSQSAKRHDIRTLLQKTYDFVHEAGGEVPNRWLESSDRASPPDRWIVRN